MSRMQPTLWPQLVQPRTLTRQVYDVPTARSLPGVGRALALYGGLIGQCALNRVRGNDTLPTPRLLEQPDPDGDLPTFVSSHVEDYLLHGNAAHLVTVRDATGWPAAVRWYPAHRWQVLDDPDAPGEPAYFLDGRRVSRDDVVHVRRGQDPLNPWRGVGVVEQHLRSLNRAGLQEAAESENLRSRGMPAVAVIAPNSEIDPETSETVANKWVERFSGPEPKPGIFPKGTEIKQLSWNPSDAEMVAARQLATKDIANLFNLDGYWLGAEGSSHTYRSPGPMFLTLLRVSLVPVMRPLEDVWSAAWLVRGQKARFDRTELLRDDLLTMVQAFNQGARFFPDPNEPRRYMGFPTLPDDAFPATPPDPVPPVPSTTPPADDQADQEVPT